MKLNQKKLLLFSSVLCLLALVGMTFALTVGRKRIQAEFIPPPFEEDACDGTPEVLDASWRELDAEVFRVALCGEVRISGSAARVWFTNPSGNHVWMKLRVLDLEGNILGETGLITPGQYVMDVHLNEMPKPGTPVILKIMTYEPETYHSTGSVSMNTHIY